MRSFADQSGIAVMAGVVNEDAQGHLYNQLLLIEPGKDANCPYTKNYPVEAELQKGYSAGERTGHL